MGNFTVKQIKKPESLGQDLRQRREALGWTLQKASRETRILGTYLAAIEAEQFNSLPEEPARTHFTKKYIRVLGDDPALQLRAATRLIHESPRAASVKKSPPVRMRFALTSHHLKLAGLGLVLLALVVYLGVEIRALRTPPSLTLLAPVDELVTTLPTIEVRGTTDGAAQVLVNDRPVIKNTQGAFTTSIDLERGTNIITIQAKRKHSRPRTTYRTVIFENIPQISHYESIPLHN